MPYVLARNNGIFQGVEDIGRNRRAQLASLTRLVNRVPLWTSPSVAGAGGAVGNSGLTEAQEHVRNHWFGCPVVVNERVQPYAPQTYGGREPVFPGAPNGPSREIPTGWWDGWQGDAHEIVRATLQRAFQISLGISDAQLPALEVPVAALQGLTATPLVLPPAITDNFQGPEGMSLSVVWMCGAARLEGFISRDGGSLTIVLATPPVRTSDIQPAYVRPMMDSGVNPNNFASVPTRQLTVVGQENSAARPVFGWYGGVQNVSVNGQILTIPAGIVGYRGPTVRVGLGAVNTRTGI